MKIAASIRHAARGETDVGRAFLLVLVTLAAVAIVANQAAAAEPPSPAGPGVAACLANGIRTVANDQDPLVPQLGEVWISSEQPVPQPDEVWIDSEQPAVSPEAAACPTQGSQLRVLPWEEAIKARPVGEPTPGESDAGASSPIGTSVEARASAGPAQPPKLTIAVGDQPTTPPAPSGSESPRLVILAPPSADNSLKDPGTPPAGPVRVARGTTMDRSGPSEPSGPAVPTLEPGTVVPNAPSVALPSRGPCPGTVAARAPAQPGSSAAVALLEPVASSAAVAAPKTSFRAVLRPGFVEPELPPTRSENAEPALRSASPTLAFQPAATERPLGTAPKSLPSISAPAVQASTEGPFEVIDQSGEITVILRRSRLLRTAYDVIRTAVVDPAICDVVQFTPREVSIIGRGQGATHVTFWFEDPSRRPLTYLVRVVPDPEVRQRQEEQYGLLERHLAELFPNSKVELVLVADKLIVRGQARDAAEAAQILAIVRGQAVTALGLVEGSAASPLRPEETNRTVVGPQVVNMLRIPGVHQVALKVKIAELNRSAARNFGVDMHMQAVFDGGTLLVQSLLNVASGGTATVLGNFDAENIQFGIHYLEQHGVIRLLSEPTLVTLSGRPATFIAGGEFAVPTTVGVNGAAAVTTDFRAYGAIITFLPVVIDKDHIRLEVAPEFSQLDTEVAVNGTPGLKTRAVTTTVEMREGQTLAIAGLLDDSMRGENTGDLPILAQIFGRRGMTRNETELLILVTPELVHPMEPEEVPPLPGFDVTEPTNAEFFLHGRIEGRPTHEYRSTVWPRLRRRYQAGGPAMISGPFGHGD